MDFLKVCNDDGYILVFEEEPYSMSKNDMITIYLKDKILFVDFIRKVRRVRTTFYDIECIDHYIMMEYELGTLYFIVTKNNNIIHKLCFDEVLEHGKEQITSIVSMFNN